MLLLDGPTGTELIRRGYPAEPGLWTARAPLLRPDLLLQVHADYVAAGARVLTASTFRTTAYAFRQAGVADAEEQAQHLTGLAVGLARQAAQAGGCRVAGSLAPLEDCYHPERVPPQPVVEAEHGRMAGWLAGAGSDLVLAETMGREREAVAAVQAGRRAGLPVWCSFIVSPDGQRLLGGEPLLPAARAVHAAGAEAVLVNCVHAEVIDRALDALHPLREAGAVLGAYGNAARMRVGAGGEVSWEEDPRPVAVRAEEYARHAVRWVHEQGAGIVGSCCGTTPEYILRLAHVLG